MVYFHLVFSMMSGEQSVRSGAVGFWSSLKGLRVGVRLLLSICLFCLCVVCGAMWDDEH